jgi:hypothetical protein
MPAAVTAMGITPAQFYNNIASYWFQYVFPPFDLATLTDQVSALIIEPRHQAQLMIDGHPYLTRLATYISPEEMTLDPLFAFNPDLPDVSATHTAVLRTMCGNQQYMYCNAPVRLDLPDGRSAWIRAGTMASTCQPQNYDVSLQQSLPAAEVVWERDDTGEGARRIDNVTAINAMLVAHNAAFAVAGITGAGGVGAAGGSGGAGAGGSTGLAGAGGQVDGLGPSSGHGCSCALPAGAAAASWWPVGAALALVALRRRRSRR